MFVGGEFYYDDRWAADAPTLDTQTMYFLNGGTACLTLICDYLRAHQVDKLLLPAYLCPSIVQTVTASGLGFDFYAVREDLSLDLEDLAQKIAGLPAVYLINYFGFLHSAATLDFLRGYHQKGGLVIEDNAQAAFNDHPTGDFIFNSLRKFTPYDGGYLITHHAMAPYLEQYTGRTNRRLPLIREYRARLGAYLFNGEGDYDALEHTFTLAEQYYESDGVVLGDAQERAQIERLDWPAIKQARRENYHYLLGLIASLPEITPIFPALQADNMPLGLPVYFSGVSRDQVNDELGQHAIGLTIHWDELLHNPRTRQNLQAVSMASRMLTLPVDQRTSRKQLDYLARQLQRAIRRAQNQNQAAQASGR